MSQIKQNNDQNREPNERPTFPGRGITWGLLWFLVSISVVLWIWGQFMSSDNRVQVSYSTFREQLKNGNVERVIVKGDQIQGTLEEPVQKEVAKGKTIDYTNFVTYLPSFGDEELLTLLEKQGVRVETQPEQDFSWWAIGLNLLLPLLLLIGLGYFFFARMRSQGQNILSITKSRARLYNRRKERITFEDVAGAKGAKTELREIIEFLKDPARFHSLGAKTPKGVLLVGPPGTGKTLLARAVAGEANVPFFIITGSDFMEMFVGVGASRVRNLFNEAKKLAPSIIFIDELDSIGRRRGAGLGGGHDEREQTLNQLLSELDGFDPNVNVIVMAATNRPDILDPALLRPGRFDRRIIVDLPTMQDRLEILKVHARNKPLQGDVDLERIARGTPTFSGADLENMLNEAALLSARKNKDVIGQEDIDEARDKILMGLKRENLVLTDEEWKLIAYHEAGHAVLAALLPDADPVHKVSIVPRGRSMGVTQQLPEREKYIYRREYMLDRLAVMMGGRAAEHIVFNTSTSGAENDLKQATRLVRKMVLDWGMSERFGNVALGDRREQVFLGEEIAQRREYSEITAREVDEEIKTILGKSYEKAVSTLREHRDGLDRLASALLENEEIPGDEVLRILQVNKDKSLTLIDDRRLKENL
ncbi:MAG TPA: ATP-dependent zinc metalloprotease FtsH [Thermodesulfobacteriota bacterium]|nr:ATP-dependent zinc metalloprotease FtsH [Thermodesulfobacteriota bacterium]